MDTPGIQPTATTGKQTATIRYVDQPECGETFSDSINSVFFDGQTMRIEFGITRMDEMKQGGAVTGRRYLHSWLETSLENLKRAAAPLSAG